MKKLLLLLGLVVCIQVHSYAQTEKIEEIPINLSSNSILNTGYPFDINFLIKVDITDNTASIAFFYPVQPNKNKTNYGYKSWLRYTS
ncbi:hypothetical protein SAMN05421820_101864 [Pedobacter steynii]|uniref:Uncharacterized protein n=1 Tax=Pedobacter steynii TaxID=430522 RepID=A0A1G9LES4_9SPHI|nr:hypothetical protein [Pedobacter steynii]NQX38825.1 hypothetical protein [Pedobacter steynii]SDL60374.1 hypothetical protein SAMN05421820_101864 [Pedobacter steynii]